MPIVVCGCQGRGQRVTQPPNNTLEVKEVTIQLDGSDRMGGPLAGSSPVYQFVFGDREGNSQFFIPSGYFCERFLWEADVTPVGF